MDVVTRDRYALFRATRIFKDLTVMRDVLRVVIHLNRKASAPCFIKVGRSGSRTSHVALVRIPEDLRTIVPFLCEAFDLAVSEGAYDGSKESPTLARAPHGTRRVTDLFAAKPDRTK